jgi:dCTP deaminase
MSVLTGPEITAIVARTRSFKEYGLAPCLPTIEIEPFDPERAGPNSYDVHLSAHLRIYGIRSAVLTHYDVIKDQLRDSLWDKRDGIDPDDMPPTYDVTIPADGIWLVPGILYLGSTVERTSTCGLVPWLDGRSSVGRLGMSVHVTAGRGDDGFGAGPKGLCAWTLEITVVHPLKVRAGMRFGQLTYFTLVGDRKPYQGHYSGQVEPTPSRLMEDLP